MIPFLKVALTNLFSKPSTVKYPYVPVEAKPRYRGRIAYDGDKCVNCGMCVKVCSPGAINRIYKDTEDGQDITYEFDHTSCTFCGMCQDFCDEGAITLTADYHMVATDPEDLIVRGVCHKVNPKGNISCNKDLCVYCTLCAKKCPSGAITVDRAAKTWTVNLGKCTKCGACIKTCPKKAVYFAEPKPQVVVCGDDCVYCTLCAKKCPEEAITVDRAAKTWSFDASKCVQCGKCVAACPKKTLSFADAE